MVCKLKNKKYNMLKFTYYVSGNKLVRTRSCNYGRRNSTICPREKQSLVPPTYTTTHKNKNVNGRLN